MQKLRAGFNCFAMFISITAHAGGQSGTIAALNVTSPSLAFGNPTHFRLTGEYKNRAGCSTHAEQWWALNTDSAVGKAMLGVLLTAKASGKPVTVWGSGRCDQRVDMEDVHQIGVSE